MEAFRTLSESSLGIHPINFDRIPQAISIAVLPEKCLRNWYLHNLHPQIQLVVMMSHCACTASQTRLWPSVILHRASRPANDDSPLDSASNGLGSSPENRSHVTLKEHTEVLCKFYFQINSLFLSFPRHFHRIAVHHVEFVQDILGVVLLR